SAPNMDSLKKYANSMDNDYKIHTNADMPKLIYETDLAFGAAGTSVWERACLGLPQVLMVVADNQQLIYENLINSSIAYSPVKFSSIVKGCLVATSCIMREEGVFDVLSM